MPPPHMMNPYMGYQYGPYQDRNRGEGEYQPGSGAPNQPGYGRNSSSHPSSQGMHHGYGQPPGQGQLGSQGARDREGQQNQKMHGHPGHYYYPPPYMHYQGHHPKPKEGVKKDN